MRTILPDKIINFKNMKKIFILSFIFLVASLFVVPLITLAVNGEGVGLENPLGVETFEELIQTITKWLVRIATPIAVIFIVIAGLKFVTARGNVNKLTEAKQMLWWTLVGYGIVLLSTGLVSLIQDFLSAGQ